jgi:hypothetical protein
LEPLEEQETQMIMKLEEENKSMSQTHSEGLIVLQEEITSQTVEALTEKSTQMREKGKELAEKFHILEKVVQGVCTT